MNFCDKDWNSVLKELNSEKDYGLDDVAFSASVEKFGYNKMTPEKKPSFFSKLVNALSEPMLIILMFGFMVAFGTNLGKFFVSGEGDFLECFGILFAVILSAGITLFMEGSSEKAFETLNKIYDNISVRIIRNGRMMNVNQTDIVVGDIVILETGDKIVCDGRLILSDDLAVNESALTGESVSSKKDAELIFPASTPLAERRNCVFSGTYITNGNGKMVVTDIGDKTEIGNIAGELKKKKNVPSPLDIKLAKLSKTITIIGATSAIIVFIISLTRLFITNSFNFTSLQELFISCIILIVAAVPEGLPTIVAVSLALNMIKLAKGNALIKKMTATETTGAISVICSDKTGTLTENKMTVISVCLNEFCVAPENVKGEHIFQNFICNSTADIVYKGKKEILKGSGTECALLRAFKKSHPRSDYNEYRKKFLVVDREPFSSNSKMMSTTISYDKKLRKLIKGAPEVLLKLCDLSTAQINKLLSEMAEHQKKARRILCFAHLDMVENKDQKYIYDGYVAIADPIRKEVFRSVQDCKNAGIEVKMLTGDNAVTAFAIAKQLKLVKEKNEVINAGELDKLDDITFRKAIKRIKVIARSTPIIKLRVVRALKESGEVVAVTGDGINDAPAIKHADVGIAMGINGSEITKESADIVLLDDSFATVVKTVAFGRNVYKNLQRFILFQLSVNLSALLFITVCAIFNLKAPFNTLQLLWINVIMDGPPALTLGLEKANSNIMNNKPVRRKDNIVSKAMLLRILFNGIFISSVMILQYTTNFLGVKEWEKTNAIFTLFILFQLFNAFNSRALSSESIFKGISDNKVMVITFVCVFLLHAFIVQVCSPLINVSPMCFASWIKIILMASGIIVVSETYKFIYRTIRNLSLKKS